MKKPKNRKFDYIPRYYKPEVDEEEKRKRRLGLRSTYHRKTQTKSPILYIVLFLIIIFIFLKYNGYL